MSTPGSPRIDVAVAILVAADGRFLLASRPAGKPLAGCWEFPGGKMEPGETAAEALARELSEELGIAISLSAAGCRHLATVEHDYPTTAVRLHPCVVTEWRGEPTAREGQQLCWQRIDDRQIGVAPLLPTTVSILRLARVSWQAAAAPTADRPP